jgi:aspartate/tyrosine/aromatic aminotransferase
MLTHLIPARRHFPVQDPIFGLNAEAQQRKAKGEAILNATLGALTDDGGDLVLHASVMALWRELTPAEVAPYAPIGGDPAFLRALVARHWPLLTTYGTGCATPGGSGALALSARNFLEPGMAVLTAGPHWGPYTTLASENGVTVAAAPFPEDGLPLDLDAWDREASALMARQGRVLLWLNDPCHNPTGRSFQKAHREALLALLRRLADRGPVTLLLDCAYLDYTTDPQHVRDALDHYAELGAEGRVLVGASLSLSKSLTLYGARGGALVFPWCKDVPLQAALDTSCRGTFSNCPRAAQSLLLRLERDGKRQEQLNAEHRHWSEILEGRAVALDLELKRQGLPGVAWAGGFFVTLPTSDPLGVSARLRDQGVFVVPLPQGLRVGICALPRAATARFAEAMKVALITP